MYLSKEIMSNKQLYYTLKRFVTGLYTTKDIQYLKESLKTESGYAETSKTMDHVWESISTEQPKTSLESYAIEAKKCLLPQKTTNGVKFEIRIRQTLKYAATIALLILSGFGANKIYNRIEQQNIVFITATADKEHKGIILPDGSIVMLNNCSSIRYPNKFIAGNRAVEIQGEAFFQITKDKKHPFIVHANEGRVKVLGTSFNIKAYKDDRLFSVSVETGKVEVNVKESFMQLLPNECLIYDKENGNILKRKDNVEQITSWMQGGLYFNNTPIQSIILELERIYGCKIELDANCTFEETLFGEHDNQSLDAVLKSIEYSTGIKNRKENERIILYK